MVGNSIRLPSWQEMYVANNPERIGNPELQPEQVTTYEAQYLYKLASQTTMGLNLFYSTNSDQILRDSTGTFQNFGQNTIKGGGVELRGKLTSKDSFNFSYSYFDGEGKTLSGDEIEMPLTASHILKAAYTYDLSDHWTLGGVWNYIGSKKRFFYDTRDDLAAYNTLDTALGWNMGVQRGWYAQGIIKNISDTIVRYPAPAATYNDDYPMFDRSFWIRAGWRF